MTLQQKIQRYSLLSELCAFLIVGIGSVALLGWLSNSRIVFSIAENYKPMPPNVSISLIILGILLYFLNSSFSAKKWFLFSGSLFTMTISFLRLIEYITDFDIGIDFFFFNRTDNNNSFSFLRNSEVFST